jgi:hypothetical protein
MTAAVSSEDGQQEEQLNIQEFLQFVEKRIKGIGAECIDNADIDSKSGLDILSVSFCTLFFRTWNAVWTTS